MYKNLLKLYPKITNLILLNLVIFLAISLFNNVNAAEYKGENPYLVKGVFASSEGKSPTKARNNATIKAKREAFSILLKRLSIYEGFSDNISEEEIADMVHSQEIINERIAGNNYSAIFNISFSKGFVNSVLNGKNIGKNTVIEESYLIFPIKITDNGSLLLWEQDNDWKFAWEDMVNNGSNPEIKLPVGDIDDISMINVKALENADFEYFADILNKYNSDVAIIAYFDLDKIDNKINVNLQKIRKFNQKKVKLGFINVNHLSAFRLLSKITSKTAKHIIDDRNPTNISRKLNSDGLVNIDILISELQDWVIIKNKLNGMRFIDQIKVNSISKDLVRIAIKYNENNGDIIDLFSRYNLILGKKEENQYFLFFDY